MIVHFSTVIPVRPGDILKINGVWYPVTRSVNLRYFHVSETFGKVVCMEKK